MNSASSKVLILLFLVSGVSLSYGQHKKQNHLKQYSALAKVTPISLMDRDFSALFTKTDNSVIYGFIGDDYQRLRIKFISVRKGKIPSTFDIYGKSMVKNNICEFKGTLKISSIIKSPTISMGVDSIYANTGIKGQFTINGTYSLAENKKQPHSGVFTGSFKTNFYLDKDNNIKYDDIDIQSDGYSNNLFTGTWASYSNHLKKTCNWGDFRIPQSCNLDIGAGEFSPNEKYIKNGWENRHQVMSQKSSGYENAKKLEEAQWWK